MERVENLLNLALGAAEQFNIAGTQHTSMLLQCFATMFLCFKENKGITCCLSKAIPNQENSSFPIEYLWIIFKELDLQNEKPTT